MSATQTPQSPAPTVENFPLLPGEVSTAGILFRVALVVVILGISGGVRAWQAGRVSSMLAEGRKSPFPLAELPLTVGHWKGEATQLDPQIVRGTGSTDLITRHYVNDRTGVAIDVIVLYGPTSDMFIHSPEMCYPKAGFDRTDGPTERAVASQFGGKIPLRTLVYRKGEGGQTDRQEVYFTWWFDGHWSTSVSSPKASERIPGMYKIQVSRQVRAQELRDIENPTESFLELLAGEMEARMAKKGLIANAPASATASTGLNAESTSR